MHFLTGPDGGSCHVNRNKINSVQWVDSLSSKSKKVIKTYFLLPILFMSSLLKNHTLNPLCFIFSESILNIGYVWNDVYFLRTFICGTLIQVQVPLYQVYLQDS